MKQNYFPKVAIKGRVRVCLETLTSLGIKGKYIVDIGSSIGWLEKELLKSNPKKLVGVEPDAGAVTYAQKRVSKAHFVKTSADKIPLSDAVADIVIMFDVLEHVPKDEEHNALEEANRILKQHGKLVLSTPNNHILTNLLDPAWYFGHRHYQRSFLKSLLRKASFKVEKFEIRGGLWSSVNLIWHYLMKWILKKPLVVNKFLERKDDQEFSKKTGIHTLFLIASKI